MMHEALGDAATFTVGSFFLPTPPPFERMSDDDVEDFLRTDKLLSEVQKGRLWKAMDRKQYFREAMVQNYFENAFDKHRIFNNFLIENSIFMTEALYDKFRVVADDISSAIHEYRIGKDGKNWEMQRSAIEKVMGLKTKLDAVEEAVQKRLHYEEVE